MSTKIYNGMIAADSNPFVIRKRINEIVEPIFFAEFDKLSGIVENARANGETWLQALTLPNRSFESWDREIERFPKPHLYRLIKELKDYPVMNFSPADISYSVHLLENGNGLRAKPLVLLFCENLGGTMRDALLDAGVVNEYEYWDNTDRPSSLTVSQWRTRKKAWSLLDVPATDGLAISMPGEFETVWVDRK